MVSHSYQTIVHISQSSDHLLLQGRGGICGKTCLNVGVSNGEEVNVDILKCPENYPYIAKIYFEECNDGKTFIPIGVDCADSKGVKPQCQLSGSSN